MKLRTKTMLIVSATLVFLVAVLYGTSRVVLLSGFSQVEKEDTERNVSRTVDAFNENVSNLSIKAADWAKWDDTYEFVVDSNQEYIESNLTDESLSELKLNLMMFLSSSKKIMFGRTCDLISDEGLPVPPELIQQIMSDSLLLTHNGEESVTSGILLTNQGPLNIVSRPILTSEGEGPSRGTLIFGKYLDSTEIARLAHITHLSIKVELLKSATSSDMVEANSTISESNKIYVKSLDEKRVAGYTRLSDIHGNPILLVRVDLARDIYKQGLLTRWYLLISIIVAGLVFGIIILVLLEKTVLSRVAKLSTDVTGIGSSGDHSARVKIDGRDELSALAGSMNEMLSSLQAIESEIRNRNREMRLIMDSVPTGLLSLDDSFNVNPEYSKSVEKILGCKDISGKCFFDLIGLTKDRMSDRQKLLEYFDLYRQELLPDKDMMGLNPFEELYLENEKKRWIRLNYYLIRRGQNLVSHILVLIEDITEEKALAEKVRQSERENMQLRAIAEDPDLFRDFLSEMKHIITHAEEQIGSLRSAADDKSIVNEIFRDVHTIKGTAGSFALVAVTEIAGQMEDSLNPLRETGEISDEMIEKTKISLGLLSKAVMEVVEGAKRILGDEIGESNDTYIRIGLSKLKAQANVLRDLVNRELMNSEVASRIQMTIEKEIRSLCTVPARKAFAKALKLVPYLGKRLHKDVVFSIDGGDLPVDYEIARELNTPLVHILRNSYDHGIEPSEERCASGKPEQGRVGIHVALQDSSLVVQISDDGRGLNPDHLKSVAVSRGFLTNSQADTLKTNDALQLIFLPGFSTAEQVSEISGRGVGMDAVLSSVKKLNGTIEIDSSIGHGTKFTLKVPQFSN